MDVVRAFVLDQRTLLLGVLVLVNLVTGIMSALRRRQFNLRKLGDWYLCNVIPFLLGYLLIYVISLWGVAALLGELWGELVATIGVGPAVLNLTGSILENLHEIRGDLAPGTPPPPQPEQG